MCLRAIMNYQVGEGSVLEDPPGAPPKSPARAVPSSGTGFGLGPVLQALALSEMSSLNLTSGGNVARGCPRASLGWDGRTRDPVNAPFPPLPKSGFSLVMNHPACVNEITLSLNNKNAR